MKLPLRFLLLVLSLLFAVGAIAITATRALDRLDGALQRVVNDDMERLLAITHARRVFRSMTVLERDAILARTPKERAEMGKKMGKLSEELLEHLAKYEKTMPGADRAAVAAIRDRRATWLELDARVRAAAERGQDEAVVLAKQHSKEWEAAIGGLVKLSEKRLNEQVANTHVIYENARSTLFAVSVGAALLAVALGTVIFLGIRASVNQVVALNTNLEGQVAARTAALVSRERAMRLVLDSTGDGLVSVDREIKLTGESSAVADSWFGKPEPGARAATYLFPGNEEAQLNFEMAFAQLVEDIFPWQVAVTQLPKTLSVGGRTLKLDCKQVTENNTVERYLLILRDVTADVERERAEKNSREQQIMLTRLLSDRRGFELFVQDCEELIGELVSQRDPVIVKRSLHTLKGSSAVFGLDSLAERCHAIEERAEASGEPPAGGEIAELEQVFRERMLGVEQFLSTLGQIGLDVGVEDHRLLIDSLVERREYDEILRMVELWSWSRTSERLEALRAQAEYVAQRLGKDIAVDVEHNDVRIPPHHLDKVWSTLVHAVRNAVDHGIEPKHEREAAGKNGQGLLTLVTRLTEDSLVVEIRDDGGGIDADALRRAAQRRGVQVEGVPVEQLVFVDGISSRAQATELSGRGVGLAALRSACESAGGSVTITSVPRAGTTLTLSFPKPVVKVRAPASLRPYTSHAPRAIEAEARRSVRSPTMQESNGVRPARAFGAELG